MRCKHLRRISSFHEILELQVPSYARIDIKVRMLNTLISTPTANIKIRTGSFLQITAARPLPSVEVGTELDGTSPPSVFIGSWNYPKVYAGPMIAPVHGDTRVMDMPESWIPGGRTQEEILGFRMSLVRGKRLQAV